MKNYGYFRVAAAVPKVKVADVRFNTEEICRLTSEAFDKKVSLVTFPELSITGYTCADLFHQQLLTDRAEDGIRQVVELSRGKSTAIIVGAPIRHQGRLYDCAVVIRNGNIKGIVPKIHLSSADARWFSSGNTAQQRKGLCKIWFPVSHPVCRPKVQHLTCNSVRD